MTTRSQSTLPTFSSIRRYSMKTLMEKSQVGQRLVSLDAFRGATIALMVLVNDPGDGRNAYGPLQHSEWNGWTITDVVFPSFLWIAGVAMTMSMAKRLEAGASRTQLLTQALRRAAILYALGLFSYAFPLFDFSTLRILGVLQRIAICYAIGAAIYLTSGILSQIVWIVSLLTVYWLMMKLIPVPGFGAGDLAVGHNLANYVDSVMLGHHNYQHTLTWDPEGIVSTLPSIATILFGILSGHILRLKRALAERTTWLFLIGNLLIALGLVCDIWLPINKKLWTSSFAIFMAGLDFALLAGFMWLVDGRGHKRAVQPLVIMGMNAIAVYMASELFAEILGVVRVNLGQSSMSAHSWIYQHLFAPLAAPIDASLLFAIAYTLLMYLIAYGLYRRGWFLRV
jgi:predicted acyltransferase